MIKLTFLEEIRKDNTKHSMIGCILKYLKQDTDKFTEYYINLCLEKLSTENKPTLIMGDFNINLLNCDSDSNMSNFVN